MDKVTWLIVTAGEKEVFENMLLCSLLSEEEILITYYEDGYLLSSYMTVISKIVLSYVPMLFITNCKKPF